MAKSSDIFTFVKAKIAHIYDIITQHEKETQKH